MELDYQNPDPLIATTAHLLAAERRNIEVNVLVQAKPEILLTNQKGWDDSACYYFDLILQIPARSFRELEPKLKDIENSIAEKIQLVLRPYPQDVLQKVVITPMLTADEGWQERAKSWLAGNSISNQGRIRSDNVAAKKCDGLLFRSQAEINLYKAFKKLGVAFAPLPVFIQGGKMYRRIEPDFLIMKDGIMMIVEVDGDTVHHEKPVEAHSRTMMLVHEGAHLERINANKCVSLQAAEKCAQELLDILTKLKAVRA